MRYGKLIGVGNTASVYEWGKDKVLKLFYADYPKEAIEIEFHNAMMIRNIDFAKPKAYEIIFYEERIGIIYDMVKGESLLDWVMKTGNVQECSVYMAKLHKTIIHNKVSDVLNYKDFLKSHIPNTPSVSLEKREEISQMIERLPEGNTLCHGDFHPGNILISEEHTMVVDFMNVCHGYYLYDVARTVFLVEYTPVPKQVGNRELLLRLKKTLADLYLIQMNVTREMIQDYLSVIIAVREGECPKKQLSPR
ncbi:phosphotransferase [Clostridium oryzae]|uniref:Homoserine kinase n=1 Tax=Clostridium oryzae TaxID=1450648 RepID=A0A1V4IVH1_9CLOT|nr:phosphotransferase [Clostridium oryzae]OPJ63784.1 homoserine kinase [Clostridium oryzae]